MTDYNGIIRNILQGVSQQSRLDRRPEQLNDQVNCLSSVTEGLGKRPGTQSLTVGTTTKYPDTAAYHVYDRGDTLERYAIVVRDQAIVVLDLLNGVEKTVDLDGHGAYLASTDPKSDFRFHTIADTTFILNKSITPAMGNPTASAASFQCMIYAKRASWGFTYTVRSSGTIIAQCTTPETITLTTTSSSVDASKNVSLRTSDIIQSLYNGTNVGNATYSAGYTGGLKAWCIANSHTHEQTDDVIYISASSDLELTVEDANHGNDLRIVGEEIDQYPNLPRQAKDGYKVKVSGIDISRYNDYYVSFNADVTGEISQGTWKECAGFGVDQSFTASTMPHILTRESDGSFLLQEVPWVDRKAGDDDTNPKPSFIGTEVSDILSYQGRLVLVSEENVVASVTFDHYNFFAETVQQESPADPIDTASSDNQVTNLHHALVFNASLVLFSDRAQFVHQSDLAFTSDTFGLNSKARFNNYVGCSPVASATSIFFAYKAGSFTGIRELKVENLTGNIIAEDITKHVDHYIEGEALQIDSSTDYNFLVVRPDGDRNSLWVYQWFDQEGQRKQSAWHKWEFNTKIHHIKIIQDKLYVWFLRGTSVSIGYIDLADIDTTGCNFPVRLDIHKSTQAVSDGDYWKVDVTLWESTLSISLDDLVVLAGDDTAIAGKIVPWEDHPTVANAIRIPKVAVFPTGTPYFIVGKPYEANGTITNPYVRDSSGLPKTKGRLRLQSMKFNCSMTGSLDIEVEKGNASTYLREFDARIIGSSEFILDAPPALVDAQIKVPIRSDSDRCTITFKSTSHLPFYISNIDWSGSYYETGRRTV